MVICANQQKRDDLLTRATTLAIIYLYILPAFTAKFDLETIQFNAINAFIYVNIDITLFMRMFSKFGKNSKVLYLIKAFYGL